MTVPNCLRALAMLLLGGIVSGCASSRPRQFVHAPDWQSEDAEPAAMPVTRAAPTSVPQEKPLPTPAISQPALASPIKSSAETWLCLNRWCKENGYAAPTCLGLSPLPTYAIAAPKGALVIHAKNQSAQWAGLELRLSFAPQMINGEPYVHALDLQKTFKPILSNGKMHLNLPDNSPVIVIDPGHGGENAGTKSVLGNYYEKEFTLDWAKRLAPLLTSNGWRVFLTRTNDSDLALSNRVACADEHKADLFLSLHFNSAAPNEAEAGLETYCLTPIGAPSTVTRGFSDDPSEGFPNNAFDIQNFQFALQVHRALLQVDGKRDRGVRRARFPGVLQRQQRPAILVEGGYLSNPREARLIAEPAHRQKLAEALASALESLQSRGENAEAGGQGTGLKTRDAL